MHIATCADGSVWKRAATAGIDFTQKTLPATVSVNSPATRPWGAIYQGKLYMGALWNHNLVYYKTQDALRKAGISAPLTAPVLGAGGGTGITGVMIGYCSFVEQASGVDLQESSLSAASGSLSITNNTISWSSIPTAADARVTHVRLYRSVDGSLPYLVTTLSIGTTTYADSVATSTLEAGTPGPLDDFGDLDSVARNPPPAATFGCIWQDRGCYLDGTTRGVWLSKLFEPESVSGDDLLSLIKMPNGDLPLSLCPRTNELVVFCWTSVWVIRGWGFGEFSIERVMGGDGIIAPHSAVNVRNSVLWAGPQGIMYYDGNTIRNLMAKSLRTSWISAYAANPTSYQDSVARDSQKGHYLLLVPLATNPKTLIYVGNYRAMVEDGQSEPWWYFWKRNRQDYTLATLSTAGEFRALVRFGGTDGYIRVEDSTDPDDDGDSYNKQLFIRRPHFYPSGPGGDDTKGHSFPRLDLFMAHPSQTVTVICIPGDHTVYGTTRPAYQKVWPVTAKTGQMNRANATESVQQVSGQGVTITYTLDAPLGVEYLGETIWYEPLGSHPGWTPA